MAKHPPKNPQMSQAKVQPAENLKDRIFSFLNHSGFMFAGGVLMGIIGTFVYIPILIFCFIAFIFAFYRSGIPEYKKSTVFKFGSYAGFILLIGAVFYVILIRATPWSFERSSPLTVSIEFPNRKYEPGTVLGGINWKPEYSETRIYLNNTSLDYEVEYVDIYVELHVWGVAAGQLGKLPNVRIGPSGRLGNVTLEPSSPVITYSDGTSAIPDQIKGSSYRVECARMASQDLLSIVFATSGKSPQVKVLGTYELVDGEKRTKKSIPVNISTQHSGN